jgi:transposase
MMGSMGTLVVYKRGEPRVCAMVKAPTTEEEDRRRILPAHLKAQISRELERLELVARVIQHGDRAF